MQILYPWGPRYMSLSQVASAYLNPQKDPKTRTVNIGLYFSSRSFLGVWVEDPWIGPLDVPSSRDRPTTGPTDLAAVCQLGEAAVDRHPFGLLGVSSLILGIEAVAAAGHAICMKFKGGPGSGPVAATLLTVVKTDQCQQNVTSEQSIAALNPMASFVVGVLRSSTATRDWVESHPALGYLVLARRYARVFRTYKLQVAKYLHRFTGLRLVFYCDSTTRPVSSPFLIDGRQALRGLKDWCLKSGLTNVSSV